MIKETYKNDPRLTREEASEKVRSIGYVRMEGHTATDQAQLDRLFDEIFPAIDAGEYGRAPNFGDAVEQAMRAQAKALSGGSPAKGGDATVIALLGEIRAGYEAKFDEMQEEILALHERIDALSGAPAADAANPVEPAKPDAPAAPAAETPKPADAAKPVDTPKS